MYILTINYPKSDGATFDFDYFRSKHLPEIGSPPVRLCSPRRTLA
jgi:hypothetical protein